MCAAAAAGDVDELRRLLARGVDINRADYDGRTALHLAASEGHVNAVTFLIGRGADASMRDRWGNTALDDAKRGAHGSIEQVIARQDGSRQSSRRASLDSPRTKPGRRLSHPQTSS